jgi:hypothetical protein
LTENRSEVIDFMRVPIANTQDLGLLIRAARKAGKVRMDDLPTAGPVFVRHVERGKETAQIGRVLRLLDELGIRLVADVPDAVEAVLERLKKEATADEASATRKDQR